MGDREESLSNVRDLISEYRQYGNIEEEDEEDEGPAPHRSAEPDSTLESAQNCLRALSLRDIKEVRAFRNPPLRLLLPMNAAAALLNYDVDAAESEWRCYQ